MDDPSVRNYVALFERRSQHGGGVGDDYPVFHGSRMYQTGNGFGDIFRGFLRFVLPVAAQGLSSFLGSTLRGHDEGSDWKTAAKGALVPAANAALGSAMKQMNTGQQAGSGRKRKKKQYKRRKKEEEKGKYHNWNF